jgi:hypothetical protein
MNPYEVEAKLYMLDAAERNLVQRVQFDETSDNVVRMMAGVCGEDLPQAGRKRTHTIGNRSLS